MRLDVSPGLAAASLVVAPVCAVVAVLVAAAPAAEPSPGELVEVEVKDVLPLSEGDSNVVLLKEKGKDLVVPIFIGTAEAAAIHARLSGEAPPRPMTHDLLEKVIRLLGATVTRVHIDDLRGSVYFGRIYMTQGKRTLELDARPSDSIALALGTRAPIFAARKVLREAGLTREDLEKRKARQAPGGEGGAFPGRRQQEL